MAKILDVYRVKRRIRRRVIYKDKALDCEVLRTIEDLTKAIIEDESEVKDCIIIIII